MSHILKCVCLFLFLSSPVFAQDFAAVDAKVDNYPDSFDSPEAMADRIKADFKTDEDKSRAIFFWIANHVVYDFNIYNEVKSRGTIAFSYKSEAEKEQKMKQFRYDLAAKTLKTKRGVCENYAALFHLLCDYTGVQCLDIPGTSKTQLAHIGKLPQISDHIWNAVKIGNTWKLLDATWAAGAVDGRTGKFVPRFNDGYFFTDPNAFFLNHFPQDDRLSMLNVTKTQFAGLPLVYGSYIEGKFELITPLEGTLSIPKPLIVPFTINGIPENSKIGYVLSNESIMHPLELKRNGNETYFEVPVGKMRGYLTIYLNNRSLISYKITG